MFAELLWDKANEVDMIMEKNVSKKMRKNIFGNIFKAMFVAFVIGMFLVQVSSYAYAEDDHEGDHEGSEHHESHHEEHSSEHHSSEHSTNNEHHENHEDHEEHEEHDDDNNYNFQNDFEVIEEPVVEMVYENVTNSTNVTLPVDALNVSGLNLTNSTVDVNDTLNMTQINETAVQLVQKPVDQVQLNPIVQEKSQATDQNLDQKSLVEVVDKKVGSKKSSSIKDILFGILSFLGFGN